MKRPWQIWLLYFLGLTAVVGAFAWLTVRAVELDRAESLARRQAELEEDITATLWRMDAILTPLLAEEAARPSDAYRPVVAVAGDRELSPLLKHRPEYVLLHFELAPDGQISSPQCPMGEDRGLAIRDGASAEQMNATAARLAELQTALSFGGMLMQCSPTSAVSSTTPGESAAEQQAQVLSSQAIFNPYDESVQQQLKNLNAANSLQPQTDDAQRAESSTAALNQPQQQQQQQQEANFAAGNNSVEIGRVARPQTRAGNDLAKRDAALQSYAQKAFEEQRGNFKSASPAPLRIVEGASRPLWMGDRLLVARRVQMGEQTVIQGCWLDWPRLKERLRAEAADLLPSVDLIPVGGGGAIKLSRLLAALPVQVVVPPVALPAAWTPIRVSLLASWACLMIAAGAAALMLHSVLTLSERRGAFVSAVTHELRTPLTTFRMYAEMLAEGMVPEAAQRQRYLETLRREADRLAHLVENVLQYARLERGRPGKRREEVTLAGLLDRCQSRLADRAEQAEMKLNMRFADGSRDVTIATDAAAVEQILFNLVDNACKYAVEASDKHIHLSLDAQPRQVRITVRDHGPGISGQGRKKLFQPFSKSVHEAASTAPGVGLGLALSRRLASELGGRLELQSPVDGGAAFVLTLPR